MQTFHPPPPLPLTQGLKRPKFNFSEHGYVAYQIYWYYEMKQHGKYFACRLPPPTPTAGVIKVKIFFFRTMSCCISNLRESRMQQHGSKYFAHRSPTPLTLVLGLKGQNSTFSEHSHVAFQIKWIRKCSNIVANILLTDTPTPTLGMGSIGQKSTFSVHDNVAYLII